MMILVGNSQLGPGSYRDVYEHLGLVSAILALQNVQGTLECYSKLKDKLGLKTGR